MTVSRVPVRDDLQALRGLPLGPGRRRGPAEHQRVAVPTPGGVGGRAGGRARHGRLAALSRPGGDRPAGGDRRVAWRRAGQRVRRQRLQRSPADVAAHLRRTGSFGPHIRADVPAALAHRPHRLARRWSEVERRPDFTLDVDAAARRSSRPARPSRSCARRTTRPASSRRPRRCAGCSPSSAGLLVVDEAYAQFADWSALDVVGEERPLVVVRTFSKTWSMAGAAARLPGRSDVAGRRPRASGPAVPPRLGEADRRPVGLGPRRRDGCSASS